ncbi:c-type cytochrome [Oceaniglobus trochenteri]|uniref:c-type cytochrome n=1 Tax=Oceaniglobus trochenteri TaxID=2763260 RepID=UPI001CFF59F9|nr:cytochrome c [Oceaniglobus trochenteri]
MKTKVLLSVSVLALGALALWSVTQAAPRKGQLLAYDAPKVVKAGQSIYAETCASCHGADLGGQPDWRSAGENGRMPAPPHDETGHTWHHPDAALFALTRNGVAAMVGQGYESDMPAYGGVLSDAEIAAVLAYIKSTWPDEIIARHNAMNAATAHD